MLRLAMTGSWIKVDVSQSPIMDHACSQRYQRKSGIAIAPLVTTVCWLGMLTYLAGMPLKMAPDWAFADKCRYFNAVQA